MTDPSTLPVLEHARVENATPEQLAALARSANTSEYAAGQRAYVRPETKQLRPAFPEELAAEAKAASAAVAAEAAAPVSRDHREWRHGDDARQLVHVVRRCAQGAGWLHQAGLHGESAERSSGSETRRRDAGEVTAMRNKSMSNIRRTASVAAVVFSGLVAASAADAAATIVIINGNAAGVGFNDPTAAAPVGGNAGTTLGQQRLIAFRPLRTSGARRSRAL